MPKRLLLFFIVTTVILCSCQREVEDIFATPDLPLPASDSNYLSRYTEFDTSYTSGIDTLYDREWYYDARKRVKELTEIQFFTGTHDSKYTLHEYRYYNNNDSVPFKIVRNEWDYYPESFIDTVFLTYNSNKLIIKDSALHYKDGSFISTIVTRFNQRADGSWWVSRTTDYGGGPAPRDSILSRRNVISGNILSASDTVFGTEPTSLYSFSNYTFTYDNKFNPFLRTLLPYPLRNFDATAVFTPFLYPIQSTINNPLSYVQSHNLLGGASVYNGTCQYVYNQRNYPSVVRYTFSTFADPVKGLFFYKVL